MKRKKNVLLGLDVLLSIAEAKTLGFTDVQFYDLVFTQLPDQSWLGGSHVSTGKADMTVHIRARTGWSPLHCSTKPPFSYFFKSLWLFQPVFLLLTHWCHITAVIQLLLLALLPHPPPKLLQTFGALTRNNDVKTMRRKLNQKIRNNLLLLHLVKMKDQDCNKFPQKVLEDSCFVAFRMRLENFKERIPQKKSQ